VGAIISEWWAASSRNQQVWTDFGGGITRTPQWRAAVNELGEIPVLEEDGVRLTQTAPILL
jgi:glutathione S-transferase